MKRLKILMIGNSFSVDVGDKIKEVAKQFDVDLKFIVLYIGGCTLDIHHNNALNNIKAYTYYLKDEEPSANYTILPNEVDILSTIKEDDWDIITLQQGSHHSGKIETFDNHLDFMIDYVNKHKLEKTKLMWFMTWGYPVTSTIPNFALYDNDFYKMYNAIVDVVTSRIANNANFADVIPCGASIQRARMADSIIEDDRYNGLSRDGLHLSYNLGCYVAGITLMCKVLNKKANISMLDYWDNNFSSLSEKQKEDLLNSINDALVNPYQKFYK